MVIGIDAHSLHSQQCGNEVYTRNLIENMSKIDSRNQYYLFITDKKLGRCPAVLQNSNFSISKLRPSNKWLRTPLALGLASLKKKLDILHVQYFAPPVFRGKLVVTIHDICFSPYPYFFSKQELLAFRFVKDGLKKASRIIAVSHFTKNELIQKMGISPDRIDVIYNGVSGIFKPAESKEAISNIKARYGIRGDYILYVGRLNARKNLINIIKAYSLLKNEIIRKYKLVFVGKQSFGKEIIIKTMQDLKMTEDIIITDYVPVQDLPLLYNGAEIFVYPSFYEGFGLPVLEAMACGVPVITSNTSVFPEIAGDAAVMIEPCNVQQLSEAMERLLGDADMRQKSSQTGLKRASEFSWENTAIFTLQSYNKALKNN